MTLKTLGRSTAALAACLLLTGCPKDFHLVLFNNTSDPVICRRRPNDPAPAAVLAGIGVEVTGASLDDFSIDRRGRTLHYRVPLAYANPEAAPARPYQREVRDVGRSYCFQLAEDNRLYLLRRGEGFRTRQPGEQPPGFPLVPR